MTIIRVFGYPAFYCEASAEDTRAMLPHFDIAPEYWDKIDLTLEESDAVPAVPPDDLPCRNITVLKSYQIMSALVYLTRRIIFATTMESKP